MRNVFIFHYVDDIMFTSEPLSSLKVAAPYCGSSECKGMAGEGRQNTRTWIIYKTEAYTQCTTPKQLQRQACELDMASYAEEFGWGLW